MITGLFLKGKSEDHNLIYVILIMSTGFVPLSSELQSSLKHQMFCTRCTLSCAHLMEKSVVLFCHLLLHVLCHALPKSVGDHHTPASRICLGSACHAGDMSGSSVPDL